MNAGFVRLNTVGGRAAWVNVAHISVVVDAPTGRDAEVVVIGQGTPLLVERSADEVIRTIALVAERQ